MFHLINTVLAIFDNFTIQKIRKYLTETETSIKIPIAFKKLIPKHQRKIKSWKKINFRK